MLVVVDAYAEVHLRGAGIGVECFVKAQDRVAWGHFDSRKQTHDAAARGEGRGGGLSNPERLHWGCAIGPVL
ncbi:hypothetical protein SZ55_3417 [Pseudomonas sp. FeS53a]|nr:hypothetical protein SZ55_3417 [Pseudomonas sp. FeS53a]